VVIPSWLLLSDAERQRMIVRHEVEHTRAGDQWLLALAPILIALFPWNPALWWQLKRLRVAIELDCDARVLRGGVSALEYGSLLLDVASGTTVLPPTLAALSEPRTSLERRIRAMTPIHYRHALARTASFTALFGLMLAGAVFAGAPTAAPVVAQQRPAPVVQQQEGSPLLVLDGKLLAPTAKLDFANLELKSVEVLKPADALKKFGARARFGAVVITTRSPVEVKVAEVEAAAEAVKVVREKPVEVEIPVVRGTVAGQVIIGETGEPAVSAQVSIGNRHAITDAQGRYVIVDVPAGERTLDVRMKGYIGRQQVVVAADASTTVQEIRLNPMTEMERATFENALPREKPASEIQKAAGVLTVEEKPLIYVDGVLVGSDAQIAKPSWPGNNVMVVIDGVIVGAGSHILDLLDRSKIDSIEVVKGAAAAALYGERARDGVIHIRTKKR
jgi:TonB-dependent SusC/RagA subfamily outer membrane receptor